MYQYLVWWRCIDKYNGTFYYYKTILWTFQVKAIEFHLLIEVGGSEKTLVLINNMLLVGVFIRRCNRSHFVGMGE